MLYHFSTCSSDGLAACTKMACPDVCSLPPETGPCRAAFPRYYYDPSTQQCKHFIYGGCQGNENNFKTFEECEKRCKTEGIHWENMQTPKIVLCMSVAAGKNTIILWRHYVCYHAPYYACRLFSRGA